MNIAGSFIDYIVLKTNYWGKYIGSTNKFGVKRTMYAYSMHVFELALPYKNTDLT